MCKLEYLLLKKGCFEGWEYINEPQLGQKCVDAELLVLDYYRGCTCLDKYLVSDAQSCNTPLGCVACSALERNIEVLNEKKLMPCNYDCIVEIVELIIGRKLKDIVHKEFKTKWIGTEKYTWTGAVDKRIELVATIRQTGGVDRNGSLNVCNPDYYKYLPR